jgi:hypothetical protein
MGLFSSKSTSNSYVYNYTAGLDQSQANKSLGIVAQQTTIKGGIYYAPLEVFAGSDAVDAGESIALSESFRIGKSGVTGNAVAGAIQSVPFVAWIALALVILTLIWKK